MKTKATYRLVSNGTALMETLVSPESGDMVTMYHPDGNGLVMTHYCSENTQSRMRAPGDDGKTIRFSFVDVTNLSSPDAMRMTGLVLTMKDHGSLQRGVDGDRDGEVGHGQVRVHEEEVERPDAPGPAPRIPSPNLSPAPGGEVRASLYHPLAALGVPDGKFEFTRRNDRRGRR